MSSCGSKQKSKSRLERKQVGRGLSSRPPADIVSWENRCSRRGNQKPAEFRLVSPTKKGGSGRKAAREQPGFSHSGESLLGQQRKYRLLALSPESLARTSLAPRSRARTWPPLPLLEPAVGAGLRTAAPERGGSGSSRCGGGWGRAEESGP